MLLRLISLLSVMCFTVGAVNAQLFNATEIQRVAWENGLTIETYPEGRYAHLKTIAIPNGFAYLSLVDKAIYEFDIKGFKTKKIILAFKPLNFTYYSGKYYVQDFYKIHVMDSDGQLLKQIEYPFWVKSTLSLYATDAEISIILANGSTTVYNTNTNDWVTYEGAAVALGSTMGLIQAIRKNDYQYELLFKTTDHTHCLAFTADKKLGAILFHGSVNGKWIIEVEKLEQEAPLKVSRQLQLIDPQSGKITSILPIPPQRYVFTPYDVVVTNNRVFVSLSTPTHCLLYEVQLSSTFGSFPQTLFENPAHFNSIK